MAEAATANSPKPEPGPKPPHQGRRGELRGDVRAGLLTLAIAGLVELALLEHGASGGTRPTLEEIPELVLTLLLGTPSAPGADW
jgi:hypothetical protein